MASRSRILRGVAARRVVVPRFNIDEWSKPTMSSGQNKKKRDRFLRNGLKINFEFLSDFANPDISLEALSGSCQPRWEFAASSSKVSARRRWPVGMGLSRLV